MLGNWLEDSGWSFALTEANGANAHLKGNQKSIFEPIHRNKFPLFNSPHPRNVSSQKEEITTLKKSCHLFSQLYIACQVREGNLDAFFRLENQSYPPSISKNGDIRSGTKSDLLTCLEEVHLSTNQKPNIDVMILDGTAIVNMLRPGDKKTFADYSSEVFIPYIERQLQECSRVDIVWDQYLQSSLKASARSKRGKEIRRTVLSSLHIAKKRQILDCFCMSKIQVVMATVNLQFVQLTLML